MNRKALCKFSAVDPFTKCFLIKTYCLSLYGCSPWSLSSPSIRIIQVALNKLLRKLWNLPCDSIVSLRFQPFPIYYMIASALYSPLYSPHRLLFCAQFLFFLHSLPIHLQVMIIHTLQTLIIRNLRSYYGSYSPCEKFVSCR